MKKKNIESIQKVPMRIHNYNTCILPIHWIIFITKKNVIFRPCSSDFLEAERVCEKQKLGEIPQN